MNVKDIVFLEAAQSWPEVHHSSSCDIVGPLLVWLQFQIILRGRKGEWFLKRDQLDPDIYLLDLARYSDSDVESTVQNSRIYLSTLHNLGQWKSLK